MKRDVNRVYILELEHEIRSSKSDLNSWESSSNTTKIMDIIESVKQRIASFEAQLSKLKGA